MRSCASSANTGTPGDVRQRRGLRLRVVALVGLGQHHHRRGPATAHQQQVALDPARIEILVQPAGDEHRVDVGRDHLLVVMLAGGRALDRAAARQQRDDAPAFEQHPVADRGAFVRGRAVAAETRRALPFRRRFGAQRRLRCVGHHITAAVLLGHPRRARLRMRLDPRRLVAIAIAIAIDIACGHGRGRPGPADVAEGGVIGSDGRHRPILDGRRTSNAGQRHPPDSR
jgi:hypothetical protein